MAATAVVECFGLCGLTQLHAFKQNETQIARVGSKDFPDNWIPSSVSLKASLRLLNWTVKRKKNVSFIRVNKKTMQGIFIPPCIRLLCSFEKQKELKRLRMKRNVSDSHSNVHNCATAQRIIWNLLMEELVWWKLTKKFIFVSVDDFCESLNIQKIFKTKFQLQGKLKRSDNESEARLKMKNEANFLL